jgi:hypothetical protein
MNNLFLILFLVSVLVLVVGLINPALLKQSSRKGVGLIFGGIAIVLFVLVGVTNQSIPAAQVATTATQTQQITPTPQTDQQKFETALGAVINGKHGTTDTSYKGVEMDSVAKMLTVSVNVSSFYNKDAFAKDTGKLSAQIIQAGYPAYLAPTDIVVQYYGQTTDRYGKQQNSVVASYSTDKATYDKISWQNFDATKLCDFLKSEMHSDDHNSCTVVAGLQ